MCISSYNSTGFSLQRQKFISDELLLFSDVLCVQEHFLLAGNKKNNNTDKLLKVFGDNYDMYIEPALKPNSVVNQGRGKGGLVTMWRKYLTKYVTKIATNNYRLLATKFSFPCGPLLLLNTYFMTDPRSAVFDDTELQSLLADIRVAVNQSQCNNILLAGDLNTDFTRNTKFVQIVRDFIEETGLVVFWSNPDAAADHFIEPVQFTHSQCNNNVVYHSTIDHFCSNPRVYNAVTEAGAYHSGANLSNHSPIYCKINVGELDTGLEEEMRRQVPSWGKANVDERVQWKEQLAGKLREVAIPHCVTCRNVHCTQHEDDIVNYCMEVLETVDSVTKECLPCSGGGGGRGGTKDTPGWNEFVRPYQDDSKFWYGVWGAAGRPQAGDVYHNMRQSKAQYHHAVRRLKRSQQRILNNKFVESVKDGGVNIFDEVKKFRGVNKTCSSRIDGEVGADNIASHFAGQYSELYSRVELGSEFEDMCEEVERNIGLNSLDDIDRVDENLVKEALNKLKAGKSDALFDYSSDCLINGPPELVTHLTQMIKTFLVHGSVPFFLLLCTLVPIVKDNLGDTAASSNYRAIAISALVMKLLDWVILLLEADKLSTDQLQFGYTAGTSTMMCTWAVSAVVEHYNLRGKVVYGAALDCSKAFDMVEWVELFKELMKRGVASIFLRVLINVYRHQRCDVRWNGRYSTRFPVTNGVRQGAVSSAIFFNIYCNRLIVRLRTLGTGCWVGGEFAGVWVYCDDIFLLSASRAGLQSMMTECEIFAGANHLQFSTNIDPVKSKTKCIIFSKNDIDRTGISPIMLNGNPLPWVSHLKHLGNILQCDNSMNNDCCDKRRKFIGKIHSLHLEFHFVSPQVLLNLYDKYACSFYGSSLWNLFNADSLRIYNAWNVSVRYAYNVPFNTHIYFIDSLSPNSHIKTQLCSKFVSFVSKNDKCNKPVLRLLSSLCKSDKRTVYSQNLSNIAKECDTDASKLTNYSVKKCLKFYPIPHHEEWRIDMLLNLLAIKYDHMYIDDFNQEEISHMIKYVCTS